jgi:hypothetical protein
MEREFDVWVGERTKRKKGVKVVIYKTWRKNGAVARAGIFKRVWGPGIDSKE